MSSFIDWAAEQFIRDAENDGNKPILLKVLAEENEERWWQRVGADMIDQLAMSFVMNTGQACFIRGGKKEAVAIFHRLKERLAADIAKLAPATQQGR